jgi:hypothetical protein
LAVIVHLLEVMGLGAQARCDQENRFSGQQLHLKYRPVLKRLISGENAIHA